MDAVQKAAEAVHKRTCQAFSGPCQGPDPADLVTARVVLDAVGYPSHESSDEGTCWCPAAEQAGRERDAAREALQALLRLHPCSGLCVAREYVQDRHGMPTQELRPARCRCAPEVRVARGALGREEMR